MRIGGIFENKMVGAGMLFLQPYDANGVSTGLRFCGDCDAFSVNFAAEVIDDYGSMDHTKGLEGQIVKRVTPTFSISSKDMLEETVRMALLADRSRLVQAATAVVDEPVPGTNPFEAGVEFYFRTAKLGPITAVGVKFNGVAGVPGTDFVVANADVGIIRILPTTTKIGPVLVSYTPTAYTSTTGPTVLTLGTRPIVKTRLLYVADNLQGPNRVIDIPMASIRPDGAHDLITDEIGRLKLTGGVYNDRVNNPSAPYGVDIWYGDALP